MGEQLLRSVRPRTARLGDSLSEFTAVFREVDGEFVGIGRGSVPLVTPAARPPRRRESRTSPPSESDSGSGAYRLGRRRRIRKGPFPAVDPFDNGRDGSVSVPVVEKLRVGQVGYPETPRSPDGGHGSRSEEGAA